MSLGRTTIIVVLSFVLAIGIAGCGNDKSNTATSADQQSGATSQTSPKERSAKSSGSDTKASSKSSKSSRSSSDITKSKSDSQRSTSKGGRYKAGDVTLGYGSPKVPAGVERTVRDNFNKMIAAVNRNDADYLCGTAYSSDYLAELDKRGGCRKVIRAKAGKVDSLKASIVGLNMINPNLVELYAKVTRDGKTGDDNTAFHFKKQGSAWKYFIYTGNNG